MKFYRLSDATFYDRINTVYQFIKPFWDKKISIFEEYGPFKISSEMANSVNCDRIAPETSV